MAGGNYWGDGDWGFDWGGSGLAPGVVVRPLRCFTAAEVYAGELVAAVRWQQTLDQLPSLDVSAPRYFLLPDGTSRDQYAVAAAARYVEWDGVWYLVERFETDEESSLSLSCTHRAAELAMYPCSLTTDPLEVISVPYACMETGLFSGYSTHLFDRFDELEEEHPAHWTPYWNGTMVPWDGTINDTPGDPVPIGMGHLAGYGNVVETLPSDAGAGNTIEIRSKKTIRIPPGRRVKVKVTYITGTSGTGLAQLQLRRSATYTATIALPYTNGAVGVYTSGWLSGRDGVGVGLMADSGASAQVRWLSVHYLVEMPDSPWTAVYDASIDMRTAAERQVLVTDSRLSYSTAWTAGANYLTQTASTDYLSFNFAGASLTFYWTGSGVAGSEALLYIDGAVKESFACVADGSHTSTFGNGRPEHTAWIHCSVGTLRLGQSGKVFDLDQLRYITLQESGSHLDALRNIQQQAGGEYAFDTVAKTVTLSSTIGRDLAANNVLELIEGGDYLVDLKTETDYTGPTHVCVRGDGVSATAVSSDYSSGTERWQIEEDTDLKTVADCQRRARQLAEAATARTAYVPVVTETAADLINPGDRVRVKTALTDTTVRVIDLDRDSETGEVDLTVNARPTSEYAGLINQLKALR